MMLFYNMTISDVNNKLQKILSSFVALNIAHPGSPTANYITVSICLITWYLIQYFAKFSCHNDTQKSNYSLVLIP